MDKPTYADIDAKLHPEFLSELFKACLVSNNVLEVTLEFLEYEFLISAEHKKLLKELKLQKDLFGKAPTIGVLSEKFKFDEPLLQLLVNLKNYNITQKEDQILKQLELFIKKAKFLLLNDQLQTLYMRQAHDEAFKLLSEEGQKIYDFSLMDKAYVTVFKDFQARYQERAIKANNEDLTYTRPTFGVTQLDLITHGGPEIGRSLLIVAESGVGKSTFLKWIGVSCAKRGLRVLHIQGEGTEEECLLNYDAAWTGCNILDMNYAGLDKDLTDEIFRARDILLEQRAEIYVYAVEKFDMLTVKECYEVAKDIEKTYGKLDVILFDYLDVFNVKKKYSGDQYGERARRLSIAEQMTNIATELKCFVATATQSADITPTQKNDPHFIITRSNISEIKGLIKPFSYVLTLNQTDEEYREGRVRIYVDKIRKGRKGQVFHVEQALSTHRFVDRQKTQNVWATEIQGLIEV